MGEEKIDLIYKELSTHRKESAARYETTSKRISKVEAVQNQQKGALGLIKWVGIPGAAAFSAFILKVMNWIG